MFVSKVSEVIAPWTEADGFQTTILPEIRQWGMAICVMHPSAAKSSVPFLFLSRMERSCWQMT